MDQLKGYQKKYLRGLAHGQKPVVLIGQKGLTEALVESVDQALLEHELIKIKFNDFKEPDLKKEIIGRLEELAGCEAVGQVGHTAILFRTHPDPEKRRIVPPKRKES